MEYLFETERLRIRRFEPSDAKCLYENHLDAEVRKWIPNECYKDLEEAKEAIGFYADRVDRRQWPCVLAVTQKETGELVGDVGINPVEGQPQAMEIGYVIFREYRGRGYATESVGAMTEFAADSFGLSALCGRVARGNDASVRVLEKNGYRFVAEESGAEDDPYGRGILVYRKES